MSQKPLKAISSSSSAFNGRAGKLAWGLKTLLVAGFLYLRHSLPMLPILNQSLWRDEAFSVLLAQKNIADIITLASKDVSPGILHYLLLHCWMLSFGSSPVSVRGLSFVFHLLTVLGVYLLSRKLLTSPAVQLVIAGATLLNPFLLQYAFETRAYSLLACLTVFSVYCIVIRRYFLAGIFLALGVFTHDFGVLHVIAVLIWFFGTQGKRIRTTLKKVTQEGITLFSLPVFATALLAGVIWTQWVKVGSGFWIKQATTSLFIHSFQVYTQGDLTYPIQPMLYTFSLIMCFFAFASWMLMVKEKQEHTGLVMQQRPLVLLALVGLLPTIITYIISALFTPIYHERYLIGAVPLLIVLVAYGVYIQYKTNPQVKNVVLAAAAIYIFVLLQASEQIIGMSTKPPINYAVNQVVAKAQQGDIIVPQSDLNYLETLYYVQQSNSTLPVYSYVPDGNIPFYLGSVLFEKQSIIKQLPKHTRIWQITPDGGFSLVTQ